MERSKSMMLLLEITIMLLVFAICASICLALFASARRMSRDAAELSEAATWAQSAAEVVRASKGDVKKAASLLGAGMNGERLELWLDDKWQPGGQTYLLTVEDSGNFTAVTVWKDQTALFGLDVKAVAYG